MSSNLKFINSYQPLGGGGCGPIGPSYVGCGDHIDAGGGNDVDDIDDDGDGVEGDGGCGGDMFGVTGDRSEA